MFNAGHSFIAMKPAPLLIHAQSDDSAANTDAFSFVSVGAEQSCCRLRSPPCFLDLKQPELKGIF